MTAPAIYTMQIPASRYQTESMPHIVFGSRHYFMQELDL